MQASFSDPFDPDRIDLRRRSDAAIVPNEVLDAYGITDATVTPLETDSFNIHFRVDAERGTFDLRRSNRPVDRGNLLYEAELLSHLRARSFNLVPEIVPLSDSDPNYWSESDGWTLFRWIDSGEPGVDSAVTPARIENAAMTLAAFHAATVDFAPIARRGDFTVFASPEDWNRRWAKRSADLAGLLGPDETGFGELAARSAEELAEIDFASLPTLGCHADYRLRNLRFTGDRVSTVFDLDTSMISTRLLDLGGTATRFSPEGADPQADIESGSRFLRTYNEASPLTKHEWEALPAFIRWRLIRDVTIYYDRWWLKVGEACRNLFDGAADRMVEQARNSSS